MSSATRNFDEPGSIVESISKAVLSSRILINLMFMEKLITKGFDDTILSLNILDKTIKDWSRIKD